MKLNKTQKYLFFSIALWIVACKPSRRPDVSHIQTHIAIERFDIDFAGKPSDNLQQLDQKLTQKYGIFYQDYMKKIVGNPSLPNDFILKNIRSDAQFINLNTDVSKIFPNMQAYEKGLNESFQYIKYYFPKTKIPKFYTFISGFDVQVPIGDTYIGIGLDMFLGANSPYYQKIVENIPHYISQRFSPENLVPRVIEGYCREDLLPESDDQETLLDKMIYNGKILYTMRAVLPEQTPDSLIMGYTHAQEVWAKKNERAVWDYFVTEKLLFSSEFLKYRKYVNEAPFTNGLGEGRESAPKLGVYIGWNIVNSYMEKNPKITLAQLLKNTDSQDILQKSKYKP